MNNSNNFLIFSHEQDVDGLFSAAVLRMAYPDSQVILTNYGFQNMLAVKKEILSFTQSFDSGTIIISDIGVNHESYIPIYEALSASKQRGFSNIWIDHHVWPEGLEEKISSVCEFVLYSEDKMGTNESKKCATELCIERFRPSSLHAKTLGCIAHRTDFPDSVRFPLPPLTGLISYYLGNKELNYKLYTVILENACRGILWNTEMQEDMIQASRMIDESIMRSINSAVIKEFEFKPLARGAQVTKTKVAISKADSFVSRSHLLGKIIDEMEVDLAIAYTSDGKLSLRSRQVTPEEGTQLDCSKLAAAFREGGGHKGAAGGFLRTDIEHSGEQAALTEIERTVQNHLEQLNPDITLSGS
jgi:oligoribonuclease NrnB/cAMP/cGMP phosphodiesterase (DHH superfamily)